MDYTELSVCAEAARLVSELESKLYRVFDALNGRPEAVLDASSQFVEAGRRLAGTDTRRYEDFHGSRTSMTETLILIYASLMIGVKFDRQKLNDDIQHHRNLVEDAIRRICRRMSSD